MRLFRTRTEGPRPEDGFERRDVSPRGLALCALGFVVALGVHLWALWALFGWFFLWDPPARYVPGPPSGAAGPPAGVPRLEARPQELLREYETAQRAILTSYGWTAAGARIPLQRAMEILAERGSPPWPTPSLAPREESR